jgi:hypothetical protein
MSSPYPCNDTPACANAKLAWFGGISKVVGDIGNFEKIRELSLAGTDELFVTCLSLVAIRTILENYTQVRFSVRPFAGEDDIRRRGRCSEA